MYRITVSLVLLCFACKADLARAISFRNESVEWWTNVSDTVLVVDVTGTKEIEPLNEYWNSQTVECTPADTLRGQRRDKVTFRQDYWKDPQERGKETVGGVARLKAGDRVLLFCARNAETKQTDMAFWVNLTKPDARKTNHAAYDNDCRWLGNGTTILSLVKKRIEKEGATRPAKKRGVLTPFADNKGMDVSWDFVRTADPDYRKTLVARLQSKDDEQIDWAMKEWAIYNLVSYPSKETIELIKPFLRDATKVDYDYIGPNKKGKITVFPLRQMAYEALKLLDASPEKPEGFMPDEEAQLLKVGFESPRHFPYAGWKQFDR
jgi:hypothetical protein